MNSEQSILKIVKTFRIRGKGKSSVLPSGILTCQEPPSPPTKEELNLRLTNDTQILPADTQEQLRQIVYNGISMPIKAIKVDLAYQSHPALEVLTTYHKNDDSANLFNPNDKKTNPYLFFVGPYDVLLYVNPPVSPIFSEDTGLPMSVIDKELVLNAAPNARIVVLNEDAWMKPIENIMARQAAIYNHEIYSRLAKATGMSYELARLEIEREAATFAGHLPADQKNLALEKLLAKHN